MRPRKLVLVVDANEQTLSHRALQLDLWNYRPLKASSAVEAMKILKERHAYSIDLILYNETISPLEVATIAERAVDLLHPCPIHGAATNTDPRELRDTVKIKTTRRRGPRPVAVAILQEGAA